MAWPTIFANLTAGNQPLSLFDAMFNQVAQMVAIPCTAAGQNSIVLTPIGSAPTISGYQNFSTFRFQAVATCNANVVLGFGALAQLPVYHADGVTQIGPNAELVIGQEYVVLFAQSLNSNAGGFYLESAALPVTQTTAGTHVSGLRIANDGGTPNSKVDVSATEVVMCNAAGSAIRATNVAVVINFGVNGANGLDVGGLAATQIYYIYLISNGSTVSGLASLSSTSPTLPGGYTFLKRVGAVVSDLTSGQTSTVTLTLASPGVVNWPNHGLPTGCPLQFSTSGTLPTGLLPGTTYYVSQSNNLTNSFEVTPSPYSQPINFTGSQSGVQTATVPGVRLRQTLQYGNRAQYVVSGVNSSTPQLPVIWANSAGTYSATAPTWAIISTVALVPLTAGQIDLFVNLVGEGATSEIQIAPNGNYGGFQAVLNGGNSIGAYPWFDTGTTPTGQTVCAHVGFMDLESTNVFLTIQGSGGVVYCGGWIDNL